MPVIIRIASWYANRRTAPLKRCACNKLRVFGVVRGVTFLGEENIGFDMGKDSLLSLAGVFSPLISKAEF